MCPAIAKAVSRFTSKSRLKTATLEATAPHRDPMAHTGPVPLQYSTQVPRIESRMHDARIRCRLCELPREEDIADFRLAVIGRHALILGTTIVINDDPVWLWAVKVHSDGSSPGYTHAGCWGGGGGLREERQEELVEQVGT